MADSSSDDDDLIILENPPSSTANKLPPRTQQQQQATPKARLSGASTNLSQIRRLSTSSQATSQANRNGPNGFSNGKSRDRTDEGTGVGGSESTGKSAKKSQTLDLSGDTEDSEDELSIQGSETPRRKSGSTSNTHSMTRTRTKETPRTPIAQKTNGSQVDRRASASQGTISLEKKKELQIIEISDGTTSDSELSPKMSQAPKKQVASVPTASPSGSGMSTFKRPPPPPLPKPRQSTLELSDSDDDPLHPQVMKSSPTLINGAGKPTDARPPKQRQKPARIIDSSDDELQLFPRQPPLAKRSPQTLNATQSTPKRPPPRPNPSSHSTAGSPSSSLHPFDAPPVTKMPAEKNSAKTRSSPEVPKKKSPPGAVAQVAKATATATPVRASSTSAAQDARSSSSLSTSASPRKRSSEEVTTSTSPKKQRLSTTPPSKDEPASVTKAADPARFNAMDVDTTTAEPNKTGASISPLLEITKESPLPRKDSVALTEPKKLSPVLQGSPALPPSGSASPFADDSPPRLTPDLSPPTRRPYKSCDIAVPAEASSSTGASVDAAAFPSPRPPASSHLSESPKHTLNPRPARPAQSVVAAVMKLSALSEAARKAKEEAILKAKIQRVEAKAKEKKDAEAARTVKDEATLRARLQKIDAKAKEKTSADKIAKEKADAEKMAKLAARAEARERANAKKELFKAAMEASAGSTSASPPATALSDNASSFLSTGQAAGSSTSSKSPKEKRESSASASPRKNVKPASIDVHAPAASAEELWQREKDHSRAIVTQRKFVPVAVHPSPSNEKSSFTFEPRSRSPRFTLDAESETQNPLLAPTPPLLGSPTTNVDSPEKQMVPSFAPRPETTPEAASRTVSTRRFSRSPPSEPPAHSSSTDTHLAAQLRPRPSPLPIALPQKSHAPRPILHGPSRLSQVHIPMSSPSQATMQNVVTRPTLSSEDELLSSESSESETEVASSLLGHRSTSGPNETMKASASKPNRSQVAAKSAKGVSLSPNKTATSSPSPDVTSSSGSSDEELVEVRAYKSGFRSAPLRTHSDSDEDVPLSSSSKGSDKGNGRAPPPKHLRRNGFEGRAILSKVFTPGPDGSAATVGEHVEIEVDQVSDGGTTSGDGGVHLDLRDGKQNIHFRGSSTSGKVPVTVKLPNSGPLNITANVQSGEISYPSTLPYQERYDLHIKTELGERACHRVISGPELPNEFDRELQDHFNRAEKRFQDVNGHPSDDPYQAFYFQELINMATDDEIQKGPFSGDRPRIRLVKPDAPPYSPAFEFVWTNRVIYPKSVLPEQSPGCDCEGDCDSSDSCSCRARQSAACATREGGSDRSDHVGFAYSRNGVIHPNILENAEAVWECNSQCGCGPACINRVVGKKPRVNVDIYYSGLCGWAVRAPLDGKTIKKGTPLGIYSGELLPVTKSDARAPAYAMIKRNYIFDCDNWTIGETKLPIKSRQSSKTYTVSVNQSKKKGARNKANSSATATGRIHAMGAEDVEDEGYDATFAVDAFHYGTWTRFCNHRCVGNSAVVRAVYVDEGHVERPLHVYVACRDIKPGEDITISYHDEGAQSFKVGETVKQFKARADAARQRVADEHKCFCGDELCTGKLFNVGFKDAFSDVED